MSEELAASIGDVLAENARLKVYLAQVTERALAAEAEIGAWQKALAALKEAGIHL